MNNKIAILIPCYNEEMTIKKVILDFKKELPQAEIYVYDNNSSDSTYEIAKNAGAIVRREHNQGKGNVVRRMFREIDADIYVMIDGDDTYSVKDVHKLIEPIVNKEADMVVGDRISSGIYKKENKRKFHKLGNEIVRICINKLFKVNLKDILSGYRAFNKLFVKNIPILSPNFEVETEMTLHALDKKFLIKELCVDYKDRFKGSNSKLNTISDGIIVLIKIFSMYKNYKPMSFFFKFAIILFIFGLIVGFPVLVEYFQTQYITKVPSSILATGLMILSIIVFQCGVILDTIVKHQKERFEHQLLNFHLLEEKNNYKYKEK